MALHYCFNPALIYYFSVYYIIPDSGYYSFIIFVHITSDMSMAGANWKFNNNNNNNNNNNSNNNNNNNN